MGYYGAYHYGYGYGYGYGYEIWFVWIILGVFVLSVLAQAAVSINFRKYSKVNTHRGATGAEAAREIMRQNGVYDVAVEQTSGRLSDHYDPRKKVIRLSPEVYGGTSISAVGVAAHEAGHAIQHSEGYVPLRLRNYIFPAVNIGTYAAFPILIIGFLLDSFNLMLAGVIFMSFAVVFQLITLPVEFNASRRALSALSVGNMLYDEEIHGARRVLFAAAMTYVAAFVSALVNLLRFVLIISNRRR